MYVVKNTFPKNVDRYRAGIPGSHDRGPVVFESSLINHSELRKQPYHSEDQQDCGSQREICGSGRHEHGVPHCCRCLPPRHLADFCR